MSRKFCPGLVIGSLLLLAAAGLSGCGNRTESTYFYYRPSFTAGGDIIFVKGLQTVDKDVLGSQTGTRYTENLATMTAAGASETALLDVTATSAYGLTCAPVGSYVAYSTELSGGLYGNVIIQNISTSTHTGLDRVELKFVPGIVAFDWSSDAKKIVYCTATEVHTVNLDGTGDTTVAGGLTGASFVSWKFGTRIAYVHTVGGETILSLTDGATTTNLAAAASVDLPQISSVNANIVYGIAGGSYCSVDTGAGTPATTEVMASFHGAVPRIGMAAAASKVVYSKVGEQSGIYTLDLTAKTESQIK
ncbi:MAG: hypothetical protein JW873_04990 [Candidatus Saganbacteria bacterium]|nr:hypothetical protein [Candidatus Saganbacteria bacterium]